MSFSKFGKDYFYTFRGKVLKQLQETPNSYLLLGFGQADQLFLFDKKTLIEMLSLSTEDDRCDIHIRKLASGKWELHRSNFEKRTIIDLYEIRKC